MRICIFARLTRAHRGYFTPHSGIQARILTALGHEVTILTTARPDGTGGQAEEAAAEVHFLARTPAARLSPRFWQASAAQFDALHAARPFDLVFGRGEAVWGFFSHSRFADQVPVILHEGTYLRWLHRIDTRARVLAPLLTYPLAPFFALSNRRAMRCMQRAARVVCITPALARSFRRAYWWKKPRTIAITYGFSTARYHFRPRPAAAPGRIISLGRLTWDKGALGMIDMLAALRDRRARLEAIGPISAKVKRAALRRAARLGVAERYAAPGALDHDAVPERLAGAHVFVFPSTHPEGLGKVVLEAMAAGLPVVAYRLPALEEIVEDGVTGFVVPPRAPRAMAERVDRLLADPGLAARMGAAGRKKIETEMHPDLIDSLWRRLLEDVLAEAARRPAP